MHLERILPVIPLAFAGVYLYFTEQIGKIGMSLPIDAKVVPRILSVGLAIGAVLWFIEALRADPPPRLIAAKQERGHWWLIVVILAWTAGYYLVFQWLGYLLATTAYLLPMMFYFNREHWVANSLTAVLFGAGSYYLFYHLLGVPLPLGDFIAF